MPGDFPRVLWRDNPLLAYLVGLCPALAVCHRLINALLLGAAMLVALLGTALAGAAVERVLPPRLRLPSRMLVASVLIAGCSRLFSVYAPALAAGLGIYLPLLAVNCLLLGCGSGDTAGRSVVQAAGRGAAFASGLVLIGLVREVLGAGTITLFPIGSFRGVWAIPGFPPARVLVAAPGALLLLGYLSALVRRSGSGRA